MYAKQWLLRNKDNVWQYREWAGAHAGILSGGSEILRNILLLLKYRLPYLL